MTIIQIIIIIIMTTIIITITSVVEVATSFSKGDCVVAHGARHSLEGRRLKRTALSTMARGAPGEDAG